MEVFSEGGKYQTWECVCGRDGRIYVGDILDYNEKTCKVCGLFGKCWHPKGTILIWGEVGI